MELPSIHAVTKLTCKSCTVSLKMTRLLIEENSGHQNCVNSVTLVAMFAFTPLSEAAVGLEMHHQSYTDKKHESAPACEGCWDSARTLCPMVLSGRAARLFQWQWGQRQGHL